MNDEEIVALARSGELIKAIKHYRERTGAGLAEAKSAVEALMSGARPVAPPQPVGSSPDPAFQLHLEGLLRAGEKIEAIKAYRARFHVGLRDAKLAVDRLEAERGIVSQQRPWWKIF